MKWFKMEEFRCRCCGELPEAARENVEALVREVLDPARERLGLPIVVNSGYRCPKHNLAVGGVRGSQHMKGEAADVVPVGFRVKDSGFRVELARLVEVIRENGRFDQMIVYPGFVHVSWKRGGVNRGQVLKKVAGKSGYAVLTTEEMCKVLGGRFAKRQ